MSACEGRRDGPCSDKKSDQATSKCPYREMITCFAMHMSVIVSQKFSLLPVVREVQLNLKESLHKKVQLGADSIDDAA
jgi:hypothetical protein